MIQVAGLKKRSNRSAIYGIVSWTSITSEKARELVDHIQLPLGKKGGLLDHLHIKVAHCSLGLFSSRT